jgi:hypothetical protein
MGNLGDLVISMSADVARLTSDMGKSVSVVYNFLCKFIKCQKR